MTPVFRWTTGLLLTALALVAISAAQVVTIPPARAEVGLPSGSTLKLGLVRRGADGSIILDTSRAAVREARRQRHRASGGGGACRRAAPNWIRGMVYSMAPKYGLDPALVLAVIAVESDYQVKAVSPKNAQGLMQLIPATARRFGVRNPFDPADNLRGGLKYLRWLLDHFNGNLTYALAGYNAGEKAVERYRGVPPYRETQHYVRAVNLQHRCSGGAVIRARVPAEQTAPRPAPVNPWAFNAGRH